MRQLKIAMKSSLAQIASYYNTPKNVTDISSYGKRVEYFYEWFEKHYKIKTVIYAFIIAGMALFYLELDSANCTGGDTGWYYIASYFLCFLFALFSGIVIYDSFFASNELV